jgi:hypothetical protein
MLENSWVTEQEGLISMEFVNSVIGFNVSYYFKVSRDTNSILQSLRILSSI